MATLQANTREDLRGSRLNKIRNDGNVPGVIYGKTIGNKPVTVEGSSLLKMIRENGRNGVFKLDVDGQQTDVMIYDIQVDPLKNEVIHVDFYAADMKSELDADVPVQAVGEAIGVKNGGVLQQSLHEVSVKALPNDLPDSIEIDVSQLDVNDSLQVKDLKTSGKYEINNDPEESVLSILPPTEQPNEPEVGEEPEGEPELVGNEEGNKEGEEE
ncbi:50S ribosomal protein L25/general stress protein Ctc [Evansella cellulosilytica]|uniref:Large ribosomal subunit protein bL25 n=1 Tax=Evansella cellulosilytica (strain ATCC 21833 / DSM 2522 / FERM P-1141 / JCM 9156 / N-4) TaxID=649639 RepID=E6TRP9_EVAC2|nr:50S ribosomal protein L25/general stress protein Ctc [Evansella cellulosilytica]ADU28343.1 ribosomal 5S rRNA E-loop binding protein Ctc/L25/TL5 [Evansella cellulosilytica DSM 2522]